ncbi:MAG: response regulator, partial [Magnetococcales bacterium]|nr:response regulator [Magnetococcales bacterium]
MLETNAKPSKNLMVFKKKTESPTEKAPLGPPWKVLVIDDDHQVHLLTTEILKEFIFENRPIALFSGYSKADAETLLTTHHDAAVIFLDVIMETNYAGLEVVKYIREAQN